MRSAMVLKDSRAHRISASRRRRTGTAGHAASRRVAAVRRRTGTLMLTASMSDTSSTSPSTAAAVFLERLLGPFGCGGGVLRRCSRPSARRLQLLLHAEREGALVLAPLCHCASAVRS